MRVIKYLVAFFHGLTYEQGKLDVDLQIVCYHVTNYNTIRARSRLWPLRNLFFFGILKSQRANESSPCFLKGSIILMCTYVIYECLS